MGHWSPQPTRPSSVTSRTIVLSCAVATLPPDMTKGPSASVYRNAYTSTRAIFTPPAYSRHPLRFARSSATASIARETQFGGRIGHGMLTLALADGQVVLTGYYGEAILALAGIDNLRATATVRIGRTHHTR